MRVLCNGNKKSHQRPAPPSKAPEDAFCIALSDVMCAGRDADVKKARRSEPQYKKLMIIPIVSDQQ
ncbi:hypothetical protein EGC69_23025 [Escherichia coli]|nr:hypothetical protein [Escherichia coli]MCI5463099.1 hypothetical protein [Escherichia coli]